jgi:hypothetical protein
VLPKLLAWSIKSFDKSLNQAGLPHLIIAVNKAKVSTSNNQWDEDSDTVTGTFLAKYDEILDENEDHVQFWNDRGKNIQSLKDLLGCYYASITVIKIPEKPAYMRIQDQVKKLHGAIERCCYSAYKSKEQDRMLSDTGDLHTYLQCAFDHFSIDLDKPFNFIEVSLRNNPILPIFAGNILTLALEIMNRTGLTDGTQIFTLTFREMVASCILLDITRHRSKG